MSTQLTVITATLNSSRTIVHCIDSVCKQAASAEHIIVDGGSTDGTVDLIATSGGVDKMVSEPDGGIYEAMNKGVALATGDVVGILNSDDIYADNHVLAKVMEVFEDRSVDSCYGDLVYVDRDDISLVTRRWRAGPFDRKKFYWGWMPPHPTFFVRRGVYEKYGAFNLTLGSAADYELMLRFLVKHEITAAYIPEVLVKMRVGGVSNASLRNRLKANRMDQLSWKVNDLKPYPWTTYLKPLRKVRQFFVSD